MNDMIINLARISFIICFVTLDMPFLKYSFPTPWNGSLFQK